MECPFPILLFCCQKGKPTSKIGPENPLPREGGRDVDGERGGDE